MKIVILDGYTLNPGDLSWDEMNALGEVIVYDRTPLEKIVERAADASVVLTNKTPLNAETIEQLPALQFIGVLATGYNVIDIQAAAKRGILVANVPGYGTASVAQLTFALLLTLCQRVQKHSDGVKEGRWSRSPDWCYWDYPLVELSGKTMGIIGLGTIGKNVADIARAFGMQVVAMSREGGGASAPDGVERAPLKELLAASDVVSVHCPLVPETKDLINKERLGYMKPSAFLINTSRGPVINEEDLAAALNRDQIAGAGLDVLSVEPPQKEHPLYTAKNCILTPHIGWATREARLRLLETAILNIQGFVNGRPVNIVNADGLIMGRY
ncbi:D-2-hydroxyacid dehydrogenase [Niabella aurantiaca]|uniref:D-2-hydroxyacid dehydrogenase n=1 Tax=Niabella aurantiaca TaxID=379900 RepID=UPI000364B757|nr:D-2-hydroxyacid dehydrogenase [Niabella aurantiaca]